MIALATPADGIRPIDHHEAMRLTAVENARLFDQLCGLSREQWQAPTDCTGWTVRDIVVHLVASAQAQASPVEFLRQVRAGRPLTAEIGGRHWVDGLNEAQLRARAGWTPDLLPLAWQRHSAAALRARRRMPAPVRALPVLPIGSALGTRIGWQPLRYLFDMGFTRDVWMHRVDIARAAGVELALSDEHDGRIVADIVAEWSRRHGRPYSLTLTGRAGGQFLAGDVTEDDEPLRVDAVEFARILSGRAEGPGVLCHKLPCESVITHPEKEPAVTITTAPVIAPTACLQRFVTEVINGRDLDVALSDLVVEDFVEHNPLPGQGPGRAGLADVLAGMFAGFPDLHWTVLETLADGDRVMAVSSWTGTHDGTFLGIPATGRRVTVEAWTVDRYKDGQMTESRIIMDVAGLLGQLGVIPGPAQG